MTAPADAEGRIEARLTGRLGDFGLDAELDVPARGVTAVIGPSGSGKTTLLRCIAGLTRLEGQVRVRGETWQDGRTFRPTHRRPIGYVFQEPSLLPHLPVRRNLTFGFERSKDRSRFDFDGVVQLLGIKPLLGRSTGRLSGGERQRVAIGRALLAQPELLLMDEPLSSLDPESKAEILPYLERIHQSLSIPVIYVSHDLAEVARLADRVLTMRDGRVLPGPVAGAADAAASLAGMPPERITRLAIAALRAGLTPHEG